MDNTAFTLIPLTDLAVIRLTGPDASSFLQSQLTQDVAALGPDRAALAGYCTARGRLLATMVAVQAGMDPADGYLLLTKADCALAFDQRLRMFVLRAKVEVTIDENPPVGVLTLTDRVGQSGGSTSLTPDGPPLVLPQAADRYTVVRQDDLIWIRTPDQADATGARWWLLNTPATDPAAASDVALQDWQVGDIAAGLPWVQAATQETFIPQTLNMDLIGGISFTKGCYPGQEVVARSHYRGTIKRRMAYAQGPAADVESPQELVGVDTFDANNPGRPCGRVINAALAGDRLHVLIEVQLGDLDGAAFRLGADDGPAVDITALPYDILADAKE